MIYVLRRGKKYRKMTEILEKSWNFLRGKKWEPCHSIATIALILINTRESGKLERDLFYLFNIFCDIVNREIRSWDWDQSYRTNCLCILTYLDRIKGIPQPSDKHLVSVCYVRFLTSNSL